MGAGYARQSAGGTVSAVLRLDTKEVDRIIKTLDSNFEDVLEGIAFEIERNAKQLAPVDTGTLRASIHTRTKKSSNYKQPSNPKGATIEDLPGPDGKVIAIVGSGVEYAAYVELGTSRMAAQPYLGPAAEGVVSKVNDGTFRKLVEG
jgi:HK97 gp10 family phage protein